MTAKVTRSLIFLFAIFFNLNHSIGQVIRYQNSLRGGLTRAANSLTLTSATTSPNTSPAAGVTRSSYSDLVLPAGSTIVKAILYVEGYTPAAITSAKFRFPGAAAYVTLNNTSPGFLGNPTDGSYALFIVDVTNMIPNTGYVSSVTAGGNAATTGRYSVADLAPFNTGNNGYGWTLMVVYSNPSSKLRNVVIADRAIAFGLGTTTTVNITGIQVPSVAPVNAICIVTGCWGEDGLTDNVRFGRTGAALTNLADPQDGGTTDAMNSTIASCLPNNVSADGVPMVAGNYTARNPFGGFGTGTQGSYMFDCDIFNATGILAPSATPINVSFSQSGSLGEAIGGGVYGISIDVVSATLEKALAPTTIPCGGTATYTFTIKNTTPGANNLTGIGFTDNIPSGLQIASPNGVVVTGGTATVTAVPGSNTFTVAGLNMTVGQTCTITLNVTNKAGQYNPDCTSNPAAFTNSFSNITANTANLANAITPQCLIVNGPATPTFNPVGPICVGATGVTLPTTSIEGLMGTWNPATVNTSTTTTYTFTPSGGGCANTGTLTIVVNPFITPTFNAIPSFCAGTVAPTLPNPSTNATPISGTWSPTTIDNTASATYTFTATTAGCFNTATLTTTVTPAPVATFTQIPAFCAGTTAPVLVSPSTNGIAGVWSPALVNNTTSGTYTFTPNAGQCGVSTTMDITVTPAPAATFNPITPFCSGTTAPTLPNPSANGISGTWNPTTVNSISGGTYTFTPDAGQCGTSATLTVTVTAPPIATFSPITPFCEGTTAPLLVSPSTNGISGTWNPALIDNTTGGTYTFTPTAGQCGASTTLTVTLITRELPTFTAIGPFCSGATVPALQNPSGNGYSGTWSPTTISNTTSDTYTFTPNSNQCATTATLSVSIGAPVTPTFDPIGPFCAQDPAIPATLQSPSNNSITGTWSPASVNTNTTTTYTFTPAAGVCANSVTFVVTINPKQVPTFTAIPAFCEGTTPAPTLPISSNESVTGTWNPLVINTTTAGTYTFTPDAGQCYTTASLITTVTAPLVPTFTPIGPFCADDPAIPTTLQNPSTNAVSGTWSPATINTSTTTSYTFTPDAGECATTALFTVTINPRPEPTFNAIPPICAGDPTPTLVTPSTNGFAGTWLPATVNNTTTGTYTFTPNANVCATTTTIIITVGPPQPPVFTQINPFCEGTSPAPVLPTTSDNGVAGSWQPTNVNVTTSGTYIFTPNPGICAETTDMNITVTPKVNPTFTPVGPFCKDDVIASLPTTSNAPESVSGTWTPVAMNNQTTTTYTFTPATAACANTTTITVVINPATTPTFTAPAAFCAGSTAPVLPTTSGNGITGDWLPFPVNNTTTATYTFTPDPGQCAETTTLLVTVNSGLTITANDVTTCANVGIQLNATGGSAGATYSWVPTTGLVGATTQTPTATVGTNTTYTVTVTDPTGCQGTATVDVTIAAGLNVTVTPSAPNICAGGNVSLTASPAGATSYTWTPTTGLAPTTGATVTASPATTQTYTVDVNNNGCVGQGTVTVTVGPPIPATFTQIPAFCSGTTAPVLPTTSIEGVTGAWVPSTINNTTSGTYVFTPTAGACATGTNMNITVNPVPALGTVSSVCDGTNVNYILVVNLTGGTPTFTATALAPSPGINGTFGADPSVWTSAPIASGTTYNINYVDVNGCGPVNVTGTKNCNCATAVGTMANAPITVCQGATATATYNPAGEFKDANDVLEYVLHTGTGGSLGTIIARSATPSFTFGAGMTFGTPYYISAIVGDNDGTGSVDENDDCLAVAIGQSVVWYATPVATAANNGPLCENGNLVLTGGVTPADPNASYNWTGGITSTQQNPTKNGVTTADAVAYNLVVTSNGCPSASVSTTLVVTPTPVAVPSSNSPVCAGSALNLTATTVVGATSYDWSGPTFASSQQNPSIVNAQAVNSGAYTLIVSIGACASAPVITNVVVNPIPTITVTPATQTICQNATTDPFVPTSNTVGTTYTWNPTTNLTVAPDGSATSNSGSNITYTVTGTANGCTSTATANVVVDPVPVISPIANLAVCAGSPVNLPAFVVTPAGGTLSWTSAVPGATSIGVPTDNGTTNIPSFTTPNAAGGQVNFTVNATRNGCNALAMTFQIIVNPKPTFSIIFSAEDLCEGLPLNVFTDPNPGSGTFTWTLPDNSTINGFPAQIPALGQNHTGNYSVQYVDNVTGCNGTATDSYTVTAPIDPDLNDIGPFCADVATPIDLVATPTGTWSGTGVANNTFIPSQGTTGNNILNYQPLPGACVNTGTITVVVNPMPTVPITISDPGCGPLTVDFTTAPGMDLTTWSFGDGTSANDITGNGVISNVYNNPGLYDVTLTNTLEGCSTSITITDAVQVFADPVASFGIKEKLLYLIDPTAVFTNNTTNAVSYTWDFGDNTTSTVTNPTHVYDEVTGTYTIVLTATSANGCIDETSQTIQIKDQLLFFVPNAFTPDGDQHNNAFQPVFTSGFDAQNFAMYIYNRWGEIIFESHNTEVGWDGTYKGELVKEGIYQWVMEVKDPDSDNKFDFQGHVFLVR